MVTTVSPVRSDGLEPDFKKMLEASVILLISWLVHVSQNEILPPPCLR